MTKPPDHMLALYEAAAPALATILDRAYAEAPGLRAEINDAIARGLGLRLVIDALPAPAITLELVGPGPDGRMLSQGICQHVLDAPPIAPLA